MPIDTIRYQLRKLRQKQQQLGPDWWKNNTEKPTVLLSADILPPDIKPDESM